MKTTLLGWVAGCLILIATHTLASGSVISSISSDNVQVTDQRALIHYTNGTETLGLETEFKGEGTNFAWIVPVPSNPNIEPATRGLFPTLHVLFRPRAMHNVDPIYMIVIWLGIFVGTFIWTVRHQRSIFLLFGKWLAFLMLVFLCLRFLAPSSLPPPPFTLPRESVDLIERNTARDYDMVTVAFREEPALMNWLTENGFSVPTNVHAAFHAYATERWNFVASKIHLNASPTQSIRPDALILRFQTAKPVFPLRLADKDCKIDLYVFGAEKAEIPGFAVKRCAKTSPTFNSGNIYDHSNFIAVRHPLLQKLVGSSPVATKLTGRIIKELKEDEYLTWKPYTSKWRSVFSQHGAAVFAANYATPVVVLAVLVMIATVLSERVWVDKVRKACMGTIVFAALGFGVIYMIVPKGEVLVLRHSTGMSVNSSFDINHSIRDSLKSRWKEKAKSPDDNTAMDITWLRQQLTDATLWKAGYFYGGINDFTGQPFREEDSPGNFALRKEGPDLNYILYDIDGGEWVEWLNSLLDIPY